MDKLLKALVFLILIAGPVEATTRVQGCQATAAFPATTVSCTLTNTVGLGNTILVGTAAGSSARVITNITSGSDTCTVDTPKVSSTAGSLYVGSCLNHPSTKPTIASNWDAGATLFIVVEEYSGVGALSAFDAQGTNTGAASTPCTATTGATKEAMELVFGMCQIQVDSVPTAGSSCTIQTHYIPGTGDGYVSISKDVTTTGAQTCSMTITATNWNMAVATYRRNYAPTRSMQGGGI